MLISQEVCRALWVWSLNACPAALISGNHKWLMAYDILIPSKWANDLLEAISQGEGNNVWHVCYVLKGIFCCWHRTSPWAGCRHMEVALLQSTDAFLSLFTYTVLVFKWILLLSVLTRFWICFAPPTVPADWQDWFHRFVMYETPGVWTCYFMRLSFTAIPRWKHSVTVSTDYCAHGTCCINVAICILLSI